MNRSFVPLVALALALPAFPSLQSARADEAPAVVAPAPVERKFPQGVLFPYTYLDNALNNRVDKEGRVDFVALKDDKNLALFVQALETADLTKFPTWEFPVEPGQTDKDGKPAKPKIDNGPELVFWINAHNALVLKTISDAYPINTIDDIKGFDTEKNYTIAGQKYSLSDIRAVVAKIEPRALLALFEGTVGGPSLYPQAYRFRNVYGLLDPMAKAFVNDDRNIQVLRINNEVTISDFFGSLDSYFGPKTDRKRLPGVRFVLSTYSVSRADRSYLTTNDYKIILKPRDRHINIQQKQG